MNLFLLSALFILSTILTPAYSQTTCFENEQVKMLDVIDLEKNNKPKDTSEKLSKLSSVNKDSVKKTKVIGYAMNGEGTEDLSVFYYKNAASEDVATYTYRGTKYYRVRNSTTECTALFASDTKSKKVRLLASLPASADDNFFKNGAPMTGYKDTDLEGVEAKTNETSTHDCRVVNDGMTLYSVMSHSCGRIKFCRLEAICKGKDEIVKAFCKADDGKCPKFEDCYNDKSFEKLSADFQEGTIQKVPQQKKTSEQ